MRLQLLSLAANQCCKLETVILFHTNTPALLSDRACQARPHTQCRQGDTIPNSQNGHAAHTSIHDLAQALAEETADHLCASLDNHRRIRRHQTATTPCDAGRDLVQLAQVAMSAPMTTNRMMVVVVSHSHPAPAQQTAHHAAKR